ncbi:MAG: hypothetical protein IPK13_09930 [Deltaproteobacteria bacterium]|nr:hypothetical protein [Deltaproteobacteria bacterium]
MLHFTTIAFALAAATAPASVSPSLSTSASLFASQLARTDTTEDATDSRRYRDQLDLDVTPVGIGMGAIFVPALTDSRLEAPVVVSSESQRVAVGRTGKRIVVPPGVYRVTLSGGEPDQGENVRVETGQTRLVAPFYGAVQLDAVDLRGRLVKTPYTLVALDRSSALAQRSPARRGATALSPASSTRTWLLPEGRYSLVLGWETSKGSAQATTLSVHEGETARYRMVLDGDALIRTEIADDPPTLVSTPWTVRWRLGAQVGLNDASHQISELSGRALQIGAFTRASVVYDQGDHLVSFGLHVSEAWLGLRSSIGRGIPLQKVLDSGEADLRYDFRLGRRIGPYARAHARTSFFNTEFIADRSLTVETLNDRGATAGVRTISSGDTLRLARSLSPLILQESVGLGITLWDSEMISIVARAGPAARQAYFRGARYVDSETSSRIVLQELDDRRDYGAEASLVASIRADEAVWIDSVFDGFARKRQLLNGERFDPVFRWTTDVSVSFNDSVSLFYRFVLGRDHPRIDPLQVSHLVGLRAHLTIL